MTIYKSINHCQSLIKDIAANKQCNNDEITALISSLSTELDKISYLAQQLSQENTNTQTALPAKPELKSGCYIFTNEKGFFCPSCYDNQGNKVATSRINKFLRVCPACRSSIK